MIISLCWKRNKADHHIISNLNLMSFENLRSVIVYDRDLFSENNTGNLQYTDNNILSKAPMINLVLGSKITEYSASKICWWVNTKNIQINSSFVISYKSPLTHWCWMMYICISNLTIIGLDNGLLPGWHQAIIWTNVGILLVRTLGTNLSEIFIKIYTFSFKKMYLKMSAILSQPQ